MMYLFGTNDGRLVARTLRGDVEAFAGLVDRHLEAAYAVALSQLRNPHDAEDAAQEAFLKAYTKLDTLREPGKFLPWLISIVRRECIQIVRKQNSAGDDATIAPEETYEQPISERERSRVVRDAMDRIDEQSRTVIALHYFAGKSTREIAVALEIAPAAVRKRLQRARAALGEELTRTSASKADADALDAVKKSLLAAIVGSAPAWQGVATAGAVATSSSLLIPASLTACAVIVAAGAAIWMNPQSSSISQAVVEASANGSIAVAPGSTSEEDAAADEIVLARNQEPVAGDDEEPADATDAEAHAERGVKSWDEVAQMPVSVLFENEHVGTILDFMSDYLDIAFVVDWRVVPRPEGWDDEFPEGFGKVIPAQRPNSVGGAVDPAKSEFVTDGMVDYIELKSVRLEKALEELLRPLELNYVADNGFYWVSSIESIERDYANRRPEGERHEKLVAALDTPVSLLFEGEHISNILGFVSEYLETPFVVDYRLIQQQEPQQRRLLADEKFDERRQHLPSEGFVPYIGVRDVTVADTLFALLTPCGLDYKYENGYVLVSTPDQLARDGSQWTEQFQSIMSRGGSEASFLGRQLANAGGAKLGDGADAIGTVMGFIDWPSYLQPLYEPAELVDRPAGHVTIGDENATTVYMYLDSITRGMGLTWSSENGRLVIREQAE